MGYVMLLVCFLDFKEKKRDVENKTNHYDNTIGSLVIFVAGF